MASSGTTAAGGSGGIASRWRDLQGEHLWAGLLDPLDIDLRRSLISYGELVQASGDGFNREKRSPHHGACLYCPADLLTKTDVAAAGLYEVTRFVYAREQLEGSDVAESDWIGYVAVATDAGVAALGRRDVVVAWRGSLTDTETNKDLDFTLVPADPVLGSGGYPGANVHRGFLNLYKTGSSNAAAAGDQVLEEVRRLVDKYRDEATSITVAGHSLGAALAVLNAVDIVANKANALAPVTAIVFGCPRVGDDAFKAAFDSLHGRGLRALHVDNALDPVPRFPLWLPLSPYAAVGVTLPINTALSPYLKCPLLTAHNLQVYLHGVAGEQGSAGGFNLEVDRHWALLNKDADALKDEYPVPASWWVAQNKFMVKNAQGKWELKDYCL